jgi:hypothetical protein
MILLIKLILAHLIGDFLLQPYKWVIQKEKIKLRAWQLYAHCLIHGVLMVIIVWDWEFLPWIGLITAIHFVIDGTKLLTQTEKNKPVYFFLDQVLHFTALYIVWMLYMEENGFFDFLMNEQILLLITALVLLTYPASITIQVFISKWSPKKDTVDTDSFKNAGQFIGIMERFFVFTFVITNHWEVIGFLIAAKSFFHFGYLKELRERKLTEHLLIGTMLSFGIAIITGIVYLEFSP